jgi:hypothetical protein
MSPCLHILVPEAVVECAAADGGDVFREVKEGGYEEEREG